MEGIMIKRKRVLLFFISVFILSFVFLYSESKCNCDCYTIIVGKKVSLNGNIILAHNEDDSGENLFVNIRRIDRINDNKKVNFKTRNGTIVKIDGKRGELLWFEIPQMEFADSFVNEYGVIIVSNACASKIQDKTDKGLKYILRRLVAERAHSAREAVKIMGALVEEYGYDSSGRTYSIADKNEGWVFEIVKGKIWVAQRVDDDKIMIIPNHYIIRKLNLKDKKNFMSSSNIISYAIKNGLYNPRKDGEFDFAKVYSANLKHPGNIYRHWRGLSLLTGKKFTINQKFPFQVKPNEKISVMDLFNVLKDHYEGTKYDITNGYNLGNPNRNKKYRPICVASTQYSIIAELRDNLPKPISTLLWISVRKPDTSIFFPLYYGVNPLPADFGLKEKGKDYNELISNHFNHGIKPTDNLLYMKILKTEQKIEKNYRQNIKIVSRIKDELQNYFIKIIPFFEESYLKLYKADKNAAQIYLNSFFYGEYYNLKKGFQNIDEKIR
jgi:dipeptidase